MSSHSSSDPDSMSPDGKLCGTIGKSSGALSYPCADSGSLDASVLGGVSFREARTRRPAFSEERYVDSFTIWDTTSSKAQVDRAGRAYSIVFAAAVVEKYSRASGCEYGGRAALLRYISSTISQGLCCELPDRNFATK